MVTDTREGLQRKEPGLISKLFSRIIGIIFWLCVSLLISIVFEWVGIALIWPEQGVNHSRIMLEREYGYLNHRLTHEAQGISHTIYDNTRRINQWVIEGSGMTHLITWAAKPLQADTSKFRHWLNQQYLHYQAYVLAVPYIIQVFFVRIAIILFSLPAFFLFGIVGAVDGFTERHLRRWGGGRESSNVYNIARKSILPVFIMACILYISLPISIHPAWVIMPFALFFGFSIRVTFERLKKYF